MGDMKDEGGGRPYHHGALRAALLEASERILEEEGIGGLTLRAAARAAGASHAAPKNHFDDLTGLLSELAAVGFRRFAAQLSAARDAAGTDPGERLVAIGRAYVAFARANPGLFQLMFRGERLDPGRPALREALDEAGAVLQTAVGAVSGQPATPALDLSMAGRMIGAWALVHGFAMLLLDGRLDPVLDRLPPGTDATDLLTAVLEAGSPAGPPGDG
jgi:AcrR family transcriptional regulator